MSWPAIAAARAHDPATRLPFVLGRRVVGSVARAHLPALQRWPGLLRIEPTQATLVVAADESDAALAHINQQLRADGLIVAWRDETYPVVDLAPGGPGERLARIERAASRFWGTLTLGTHATGYVAGADGRPAWLWIARRALDKATDPGLWDNLIGGGVPDGQTPLQALVREGWEEAGLTPQQLAPARAGRVIRLRRNIPEGLQLEDVHSFDLPMPAGLVPHNQDGEVAGFELLGVTEALARAAGDGMTVDAALATLEFALRHGLIDAPPGADALFAPL